MKLQPKVLCTVNCDEYDFAHQLQYALHQREDHNEQQDEQQVSPSCLPWLSKCVSQHRHTKYSSDDCISVGFALCNQHGSVKSQCKVQIRPGTIITATRWRPSGDVGTTTWLSPSGTWSATAVDRCSLILTDNRLHFSIPGPGGDDGLSVGLDHWQQMFVHDAGAAVLALGYCQKQLVMYLWRQIANTNSHQHQHQQQSAWLQLPALPLCSSSVSSDEQMATVTTHAVFVQQQLGGLQLYVAHTKPISAGAILLCVLQQAVYGLGPSSLAPHSDASAGPSSWRQMCISLPGTSPYMSLSLTTQQQQQPWHVASHLELTDAPVSTPAAPAAATAAAVRELLMKSSKAVSAVRLAWHPQGSRLAVALSASEGGAWVLLFNQGAQEVHECCWNNLLDKKSISLLHHGPCHISSMAWLSASSEVLAVIDTHGRLCLLSGGAFERLQLVDTAGMTITFKPVIQLQFSMLLAATSSSQTTAAALTPHFLLASVPGSQQALAGSKLRGNSHQLAIWNGRQLLLCTLYPGVDPSQRRIDQTVNSRTLLLYGTSTAAKLTAQQQQQLAESEDKGRRLGVRQPEVAADSASALLTPGMSMQSQRAGTATEARVGDATAQDVTVMLSPLLNSQSQTMQLHQERQPDAQKDSGASSAGAYLQHQQQLDLAKLMAEGTAAFVAGRWQECEQWYRQGLPLTAGHVISVLLCQYKVQEALALLQQLLADTLQAVAAQYAAAQPAGNVSSTLGSPFSETSGHPRPMSSPKADTAAESARLPSPQQMQLLQMGMQLAASLCGLIADVLLAAVTGVGDTAAAGHDAGHLPCIFPTPRHWTKWVQQYTSQQDPTVACAWQLTAGMAVELVPASVLAAMSQQTSGTELLAGSHLQHIGRFTAATAAGLLLMSEVLAAEADGVPLPADLPELLTDAIANTVLPLAYDPGTQASSDNSSLATGRASMWQHAAVLAVGCGKVLERLQLQPSLTELFDAAARSVLWRQLASQQLQPMPALAQQAVEVVAVAASLWPVGHPSLQRLTNQVLGLLCNCLGLRALSLPVLPPAGAAASCNPADSLRQAVVRVLLQQALPAAMPSAVRAMQSLQGAASAEQGDGASSAEQHDSPFLQHHGITDREAQVAAYIAAAQAVLDDSGMQQLLRLLAAMCLRTHHRAAVFKPGPLGAMLAAAKAELTAEAWAPHLQQYLVSLSLFEKPAQWQLDSAQVSPAVLAELSCQCDMMVLSSAVLLVIQAANGLSTDQLFDNMQQHWGTLASAGADPISSRMRLLGKGSPQPLGVHAAPEVCPGEAIACVTNAAWLMHCRQQVATSPPKAVASWVVSLAAANGLHKQQHVQQTLLAVLSTSECHVTQQDVQQLQDVLGCCCGGVLPRTADQLNRLKLASDSGNKPQQHHNLRSAFLQQLAANLNGHGSQDVAIHGGCPSNCLIEGLAAVRLGGINCLESYRQAVPGLQACIVHPLADGPEPSATSAYLALTALLLGSGASTASRQSTQPQQAVASAEASTAANNMEAAKKLPAGEVAPSSINIHVLTDDGDLAATAAAADMLPEAAASVHAAAVAWQQQHIAVLQDKHLMQDVREALGGFTRQWSLGSFFAPGSLMASRMSLMQSTNLGDFSDFLLPSNSFIVPQEQLQAAPATAAVGGHTASSTATGARVLSSGSQAAAQTAVREQDSPRSRLSLQLQRSGVHQWNNPLAAIEVPALDSFYGIYSPVGSVYTESAPVSPSRMGNPSALWSAQHSQQAHNPTSPTSLQSVQLQRLGSAAARNSAPGSVSSSMHGSPRSPLAPDAAAGAQLSTSTSFMRHYSPLQHYQALRHQHALPAQPSRQFRARSLSRTQSTEVWDRRSSFGGAMDAIAPKTSGHTPNELPAVDSWGSIERSGLLLGQDSAASVPAKDAGAEPAGSSSSTGAQRSGPHIEAANRFSTRVSGVRLSLGAAPAFTAIQEHDTADSLGQQSAEAAGVLIKGSRSAPTAEAQHVQDLQQTEASNTPVVLAHSHVATCTSRAGHVHAAVAEQQQRQHNSSSPSAISRVKNRSGTTTSRGGGSYSSSPRSPRASSSTMQQVGSSNTGGGSKAQHSQHSPSPQMLVAHRASASGGRPGSQQQQHGNATTAPAPGRHARDSPRSQSHRPESPRDGTGYAAQHAAHSKSRSSRPVGEAAEYASSEDLQLLWQVQFPVVTATEVHKSVKSSESRKQLSLGKRWLHRLQRACRWPVSEQQAMRPKRFSLAAGPIAEGIEANHTAAAALPGPHNASSAAMAGHASGVDSPPAAATPAAATPGAAAAVATPSAAALHSMHRDSISGDAGTSPDRLSPVQQQHLDELLKAHLPEFINLLTRGLSPVQESLHVGSTGPRPESRLSVQQEHSPGLSMQRSFSMVELHDAAASSPVSVAAPARFRASAEDVISMLKSHLTELSHPSSSGCVSTGSVTMEHGMHKARVQQMEVTSAGPPECPAATLCDLGLLASLQVALAARVHIPSLAIAQGRHLSCSNSLLNAVSTSAAGAAMALGEAVESTDNDGLPGSPGSCSSSAAQWGAEPQLQQGAAQQAASPLQRVAGSSFRRSSSFDNIAHMMERVRHLFTSLEARAQATTGHELGSTDQEPEQQGDHAAYSATAAAAAQNYMDAMENGAGVDATSNAATAAVEEQSDLDMSEFMACYSPAEASRQLSNAGSVSHSPRHVSMSGVDSQRMLAAAAAVGAATRNPLASTAATEVPAIEHSSSPRATSSVPDLDSFWADSNTYSGPTTRVHSRQVSTHRTPTQHKNSIGETAAAASTTVAVNGNMLDAAAAATAPLSLAGTAVVAGSADRVSADGSRQFLRSPSSSQKTMLLHGPSRLSLQTAAPQGVEAPGEFNKGIEQLPETAQVPPPVTDAAGSDPPQEIGAVSAVTVQPPAQSAANNAEEPHVAPAAAGTQHQASSAQLTSRQQAQEQHEVALEQDISTKMEPQQQQQHEPKQQEQKKGSLKRMLFGKLGKSDDGSKQQQQGEQHEESLVVSAGHQSQLESPPKRGFFAVFGRSSQSASRPTSESGTPQKQQQPSQGQLDFELPQPQQSEQQSPAGKKSPSLFSFFRSSSSGKHRHAADNDSDEAAAASDAGSDCGNVSMIAQAASCPTSPLPGVVAGGARSPVNLLLDGGVLEAAGKERQQQLLQVRQHNEQEADTAAPHTGSGNTAGDGQQAPASRAGMHPAMAAPDQQQPQTDHVADSQTAAPVLPVVPVQIDLPAPGSPVVEVLANSMQRIAAALEDFLCDRSPATTVTGTPGSTRPKAAAGRSPLRPMSGLQEQGGGWAASTPLQRRSALQQQVATWSPAAVAAKARILGSRAVDNAPAKDQQPQQHAVSSTEAGVDAHSPGQALASPTCQDGPWLHPTTFDQQQQGQDEHVQNQQQDADDQPTAVDAATPAAAAGASNEPADSAPAPASLMVLAARAVGCDLLARGCQASTRTAVVIGQVHTQDGQQQQPQQADIQSSEPLQQVQQPPAALRTLQTSVNVDQLSAASLPPAAADMAQPDLGPSSSEPPRSPLRRGWQRSPSLSPSSSQHPRLWRPANLRTNRTRVAAAVATTGKAGTVDMCSAAQTADLQQQQWHQAAAVSSALGDSAAAVCVGPAPGRTRVPSLGVRHPVGVGANTAPTTNGGSARCLVASADVKLIQRGAAHTIRLLRPTQLQEEVAGSTQQQQRQCPTADSVHILRPTASHSPWQHPTRSMLAQDTDPSAAQEFNHTSRPAQPRLVRFSVAVESNPLQPPVLLHTSNNTHSAERKARDSNSQPVELPGQHQQQQGLWGVPWQRQQQPPWELPWQQPVKQQQQLWSGPLLQQQEQQPRAPWETAHAETSAAEDVGGTLTAGQRAARLLHTLTQPHMQPHVAANANTSQRQVPVLQQAEQQQQGQQQVGVGATRLAATQTGWPSRGPTTETVQEYESVVATQQPATSGQQVCERQPLHKSPGRSPRRGSTGISKKWLALQQLKARNRSRKPAAGAALPRQSRQRQQQHQAKAPDGASAAADRLVQQLQQLMQGNELAAAAATNTTQAGDVQTGNYQTNLDAAAAMALLRPSSHSRATQQRPLSPGVPTGLEDSISFGSLDQQPAMVQGTGLQPPRTTEQQPLLLPRMLSRAPMVDAEVQAGVMLHQQIEGQQQAVEGVTAMPAALPKLDQHRQPPVELPAEHAAASAAQASSHLAPAVAAAAQQHQQHASVQSAQIQQPAVSPAALVALAAAAGAGAAAAAVQAASPRPQLPVSTVPHSGLQPNTLPAASADPASQQQPGQHDSAAELARLILGAFEHAGGVITPDRDALAPLGRHADATAPQTVVHPMQPQQQLDLLPNPLAGRAAPQFSKVVDYSPWPLENNVPWFQQDQHHQDQLQLLDQQQEQQQQIRGLVEFTTNAQPHLGCCFAACPQRIPSPTWRGSPTLTSRISPPRQHGQHKAQQPQQAQPVITSVSRRVETRQLKSGVGNARNAAVAGTSKSRGAASHKQLSSSKHDSSRNSRSRRHHHHHHHRHDHRHQQEQTSVDDPVMRQQQHYGAGASSSVGVLTPTQLSSKNASKLHELRQSRQAVLQRQQSQQQHQQQQQPGIGMSEWANQQTRQLADLWQQWQAQQAQASRQQSQQLQPSHPQLRDENTDPSSEQSGLHKQQLLKGRQQQQQQGAQAVESAAAGSCSDSDEGPPAVYMPERYTEPPGTASAVAPPAMPAAGATPAVELADARAAARKLAEAEQLLNLDKVTLQCIAEEQSRLDAAYARAAAARAAAKAAAERAAAARSQRLRAELTDLSKMLSEVDQLAAQMEEEAADTAAVIEQYTTTVGAGTNDPGADISNDIAYHHQSRLHGDRIQRAPGVTPPVQHVGSFHSPSSDPLCRALAAVAAAAGRGGESQA